MRLYEPLELINKFEEYIDWVEKHPLYRHSLIQKTGETVKVPLSRPLSINAFALFARMSTTLLAAYAKLPEYKDVVDFIKTTVYVNKYEGAAVGLFSSSIMIRDLGLSDSVVHILDDNRKTVSELFPPIETINAIVVSETNQNEILMLNEPEYGNANQHEYVDVNPANQQEPSLLNSNTTEQIETWSGPGGIEQKREDFLGS